jgi:hypothetical protein
LELDGHHTRSGNVKALDEQGEVPDLSKGWLGDRSGVATGIIETIIRPMTGPRPKRFHPDKRGFVGTVMESLAGGFRALNGSRVWLFSRSNDRYASIQMEDSLVIRILGVPVIEIGSRSAKVPVLTVGSPGRSWIELYMENGEKRYVSITASGRLSVRKTPPEKKI